MSDTIPRRRFMSRIGAAVLAGAAVLGLGQAMHSSPKKPTHVQSNCQEGGSNCHHVRFLAEWWLPGTNPTQKDPEPTTVVAKKAGVHDVWISVERTPSVVLHDRRPGYLAPPRTAYMIDQEAWVRSGTKVHIQVTIPMGLYAPTPGWAMPPRIQAHCYIVVDGTERKPTGSWFPGRFKRVVVIFGELARCGRRSAWKRRAAPRCAGAGCIWRRGRCG